MSGGIPSGSDPAGMSPFPFSIVGAMVGGLHDRTQENVSAQLTSDVQNDETLTSMSDKVFAGINPELGVVAGTIEAMLHKMIGSIPVIGPDAAAWVDELLDQLETFYTNLGSLLGSLNFMDPGFDPVVAAQQFVDLMLAPLNFFLGIDSPLDATNIFNLIPTGLLGFIPASAVGDANVNLITNPDFEGDTPIESSVYTLDLTDSYSAVGGCAKVIADGSGAKDLLSPDLIRVSLNQEMSASAMVKWTGLVGSGTPIRVGITGYTAAGSAIVQPDVATHTVSSSSDWIQMTGTYKITNSSVVSVRLRLTVTPTATAGTVKWDHVDLHKTNKIQTNLIADSNGNGLPDILDDFNASVVSILNQIPGFAQLEDFLGLKNVLGGSFGSDLTAVGQNLANFLTPSSHLNANQINTGAVDDQFIPGLLTTMSNIVSGLLNIPSGSVTHTDAQNALTHTSDTMTTLSAQIAELQSQRTSGVVFGEDWERTASDWGSNWDVSYTGSGGTVKVDGHNGYFDGSGVSARSFIARYIPGVANGFYQTWSVTLNAAPETPGILPPGDPAFNDVLGRMNSAKTDYIRFRVGNGIASITRVVAGVATELNSRAFPTPGPGSTLKLQCGGNGNVRYFRGTVNDALAVDIAEVGVASPVDDNHKQGGVGGVAGQWLLLLRQSKPGSMRQFIGGDQ